MDINLLTFDSKVENDIKSNDMARNNICTDVYFSIECLRSVEN